MARAHPTHILVFGAGKVGSALAKALGQAGFTVVLRAARRGVPSRLVVADVVVLAVRDAEIAGAARGFAEVGVRGPRPGRPTVLHCAGALGPEVLAPCRDRGMVVAQMHPLLSFAGPDASRSRSLGSSAAAFFRGATAYVRGDAAALSDARVLAKRLGLVPRSLEKVPAASYHGAAALVANGGAALCNAGIDLLHASGVSRRVAAQMLGPLLRSVADNVERLGLPGALTGPIRRGDAHAVEVHLAAIAADVPSMMPLYLEAARAQLDIARALGEASPAALRRVERALSGRPGRLPRSRRRM